MLDIVSMNIEGIKGNKVYLKELLKTNSILCLQEHWLHGYESVALKEILPDCDYHISSFDDNLIDLEIQRRRGKGGVITIWPQSISHKVRKLEKEERIIVTEIQSEPVKIILVNNYMPTMATGSDKEYREHLDNITSMIDKYEQTHNVVIVGDLNGTLIPSRNNNHDKLLKNFCSQHQLKHTVRNAHKPTFYHHNGNSTSQIDYILENIRGNNLLDSTIMDQNPLNSSAHVPVKAKTNLIVKGKTKINSTTSKKKTILKWEEKNIENYQPKVIQVRKKTEMQKGN